MKMTGDKTRSVFESGDALQLDRGLSMKRLRTF